MRIATFFMPFEARLLTQLQRVRKMVSRARVCFEDFLAIRIMGYKVFWSRILTISIFLHFLLEIILFTIIWCGFFTFIILRFVDNILGLRISEDEEEVGIDLSEHGESSYNSN